jgi:response regulator RpfG family c-di-GMP phosphodiesterase
MLKLAQYPTFSNTEASDNNYDSIVYKTSRNLEDLDNSHNWECQDQLLFFFAVTIGQRDPKTADHCERLVKLAKEFGEYLELSQLDIRDLIYGSYLHDVGKVGTPDKVLLKNEKLNPDEWEIMKQHVLIGEKI